MSRDAGASALRGLVAAELDRTMPAVVADAAHRIAQVLNGEAVLFYGSVLRTGDLGGVLDFYVLRAPGTAKGASRRIWPDVSYHEVALGTRVIRAKVATMDRDTFARAAAGETRDTTIWARFVQPVALIWSADPCVHDAIVGAVANAAVTAAHFAALHGPASGTAGDYWRALFRATYATEFRVEAPGREDQILSYDRARYDALLPIAWTVGAVAWSGDDTTLTPVLTDAQHRSLARQWARARRWGRKLNAARLVKAAFTFDGATRYALWKIERHTGLSVPLTPFRERHPVLAAPGVLWRLWQHRRLRAS
ncbi:hypothetical protein SAMN05216382_1070 [Sphingomonas palmae]|uniref:Uncharacterized protein n=1 Tax=Sphingomonas palmae TaxID=1855283 RepID=A0A1H7KVQ0_9SPHN|nr:hypothetical protein [Sphingomonas palmae]SEK90027.1 hypothetical protein SAMN05216382_1070 [Sphingomonas palmae]